MRWFRWQQRNWRREVYEEWRHCRSWLDGYHSYTSAIDRVPPSANISYNKDINKRQNKRWIIGKVLYLDLPVHSFPGLVKKLMTERQRSQSMVDRQISSIELQLFFNFSQLQALNALHWRRCSTVTGAITGQAHLRLAYVSSWNRALACDKAP